MRVSLLLPPSNSFTVAVWVCRSAAAEEEGGTVAQRVAEVEGGAGQEQTEGG